MAQISHSLKRLAHLLHRYYTQTAGVMIIVFALILPVLVGLVGLATDSALAYLERERLSRSCDAAALAAASSSVSTNADLFTRFQDFFEANYPPARYGPANEFRIFLDDQQILANNEILEGDLLRIEVNAPYNVTFARIFGVDSFNLSISCEVQRDIRQLEVALVLDVTGSMQGSKIRALREAATDFVNIVFDRVPDDSLLRVALVPFVTTVNVGDEVLNHPDMFIPPIDVAKASDQELHYDPDDYAQWQGCVYARDFPYDYQDTDTNELNGGPWHGFIYPDNNRTDTVNSNNYIADDGVTYNLLTPYQFGLSRRTPNLGCPSLNPIQPLMSDREALLNQITGSNRSNGDDDGDPGLRYWFGGGTMANIGMAWAERVLSPEPPFTQGVAYDDPQWRKAVVVMTDGENLIISENYTAYGDYFGIGAPEKLGTLNRNAAAAEASRRFGLTCENMKSNGIIIYTIIFGDAANNGTLRDVYENCASDVNKFFPAPDNDDLIPVFQQIARELSNLHLRS